MLVALKGVVLQAFQEEEALNKLRDQSIIREGAVGAFSISLNFYRHKLVDAMLEHARAQFFHLKR